MVERVIMEQKDQQQGKSVMIKQEKKGKKDLANVHEIYGAKNIRRRKDLLHICPHKLSKTTPVQTRTVNHVPNYRLDHLCTYDSKVAQLRQ